MPLIIIMEILDKRVMFYITSIVYQKDWDGGDLRSSETYRLTKIDKNTAKPINFLS